MYKTLHFPRCTSTNDLAKALVAKEVPQRELLITTDYQTAGRGMQETTWESIARANLLFSLVMGEQSLHDLPVVKHFYLVIVGLLASHDLLRAYGLSVAIKWPNDIYCGQRKIAGMLVESKGVDKLRYAIFGVGLNVNQTSFATPQATSLRCLTGRVHNRARLLHDWCVFFRKRHGALRTKSYDFLRSEYISRLHLFGRWTRFRLSSSEERAKIVGVTESGRLRLQTARGTTQCGPKEVAYLPDEARMEHPCST